MNLRLPFSSDFLIPLFMGGVLCLISPSLVHSQTVELVSGQGSDEKGTSVQELKLVEPFGVDFDRQGNMYVVEMTANRIKRILPNGKVELVAGTGEKGFAGDGGPAIQAKLDGPHHLMMSRDGNLLIADTWNGCVRKVDLQTGMISTVAGNGTKGFSGDNGPANKAQCAGVYAIATNRDQSKLWIADLENRRVRSVDWNSGTMTTVAGNGKKGIPIDGEMAIDQPLVDPRAVAVDSADNLYILERGGNALRVVDRNGKIRTVVGTGKQGHSGDGENALNATMNGPKHLAIDRDESVLILDTENHVMRRYDPKTQTIQHVAGTGKKGNAIGSDLNTLEFFRPHGIFVRQDGWLYISDSSNGRLLKVKPSR